MNYDIQYFPAIFNSCNFNYLHENNTIALANWSLYYKDIAIKQG